MKEYRAAAAILSAALIAGFAAIPVSAGSMGASGPVSPIQLYTGFTYQMEWSEEANRYLAESICPKIAVDEEVSEAYPELDKAFERLNELREKEYAGNYQTLLEDAKERYQEDPDYLHK